MLALWFDFWPSNYGPWPPNVGPTITPINSCRTGIDLTEGENQTRSGVMPITSQ